MNWNRIKLLLSFLLTFILHGCTIPTDFYIQNLTNEIKTIRIKYDENMTKEFYDSLNFEYHNGILNPKKFKRNKKIGLKTIEKSTVNDAVIEIKISAVTTTRVAKSYNYVWLNRLIEDIEIDGKKIDIKEIVSKSERIKSDYVYKIE